MSSKIERTTPKTTRRMFTPSGSPNLRVLVEQTKHSKPDDKGKCGRRRMRRPESVAFAELPT